MGAVNVFILLIALFAIAVSAGAHNITEVLAGFPEYSEYNSYLTQTKLADEINSRQTITVLVLPNGAMSGLVAKHPLSVVKKLLAVQTLLDYWDAKKLHAISDGTTLSTTLYQTTGNAPGNQGFVNITDLKGGKVGFGPAAPGSDLKSTYVKAVKQIPYNFSVIEISEAIVPSGILAAPAPTASDVNITALLEKAGCKTFVSLIVSTGVLKVYQTEIEKGLTVFAPNDEAFKAAGVPDLSKLTNAEVVSLLQYHALGSYSPIGTLKTSRTPITTLATNGPGKYDLTVSTAGDSVTLHTGVDSSRVAGTVIDATPLCIFTVDSVLLPAELFGKAPSPAPAGEPVTSPSPSPEVSASPAPANAPSPVFSPPAPPTSSPDGAPSDGPTAEAENSSTNKSAAGDVNAPALLKAFATVSASVIISVFLS